MAEIDRRGFLAGVGGLAAAAAFASPDAVAAAPAGGGPAFPRKADFALPPGLTYLNGAYTHPMPVGAADAVRRNADRRSRPGLDDPHRPDIKAEFAALINAKPSEISFVPNTSTGENLVVNGLGIPRFDGNVVTDALHFDGALVHLQALQKQGLDLRIVKPREGRILLEDMAAVVDRRTRLVEISLVAMYNGFQHDLNAVCDLAHAHGAYVYADIVQAAGAVPIDVRASGVDFCACSSFKWLMGDFGLGFLYARDELLDRVITRSQWGYHSTTSLDQHFPPFDPQADTPVTWTVRDDASGHFEVGSIAYGPYAALGFSLPYIRRLGVERIEQWRQPLLKRLQAEMPRLGFVRATPDDSTSPLVTFATTNGRPVMDKLRKANVNARVSDYFIRLSPSVYNDLGDVDRLLEALAS